MNMKKIMVAMSGGVDSAASCILLKNRGYEVVGGTMLLRDGGEGELEDARRAAAQLGIEFHAFDLRKEFFERVITPFMRVYQSGGTPNPCVVCNGAMKFGILLGKALELGCDGIATGHYARIFEQNGRYLLRMAADRSKDQTYVLCRLNQFQLSHTLFPLGEISGKEETRALVRQAGLELAKKHDSQDICFVPDGDYMGYLTSHGVVPQEGNFVSPEGKIYGKHRGMEAYTVGQRRGLGLSFGQRVYVLGKRGTDVVLGEEKELFSRRVVLRDVSFLPFDELTEPMRIEAKLRYTTRTAPALLVPRENGCELIFDEAQRAATCGQTAAFYLGDTVLGGGTIVCAEQRAVDSGQ